MKLKLGFATMSVSVLLTACQHTQTSRPEAVVTAPVTAPAAPAAPAAAVTPAGASASNEIIVDDRDPNGR